MTIDSTLDEIIHHDDDISAERTPVGTVIRLRRPVEGYSQLGVIAVLWDLCRTNDDEDANNEIDSVIHVDVQYEMSPPLMTILSAIKMKLESAGRKLYVMSPTDAFASSTSIVASTGLHAPR